MGCTDLHKRFSMDSGSIWREVHSLESLDTQPSKHAIAKLQSWISEGVAIIQLVEHYANSQSVRALELLCLVQEPHDSILLDKMLESISQNPQGTLVLLGRLVQKAPCWIPKLPHHLIFRTIMELVKMENDLEIVIAGMLFITSVLPFLSTLNEHLFTEIFNAFIEACRIFATNQVIFTKIHPRSSIQRSRATSSAAPQSNQQSSLDSLHHQSTLHSMKSALFTLFRTFYAIWPCNVVYMLKEFSLASKQNSAWDGVWTVIEHLFLSVRLHPSLIFDTRAKELSRERWVHFEIHDFFALAQRISAGRSDSETEEDFFELDEEQEDGSSEHSFGGGFTEMLDGFFTSTQVIPETSVTYSTPKDCTTLIDIGLGVEAGLNTPPPESRSLLTEDREHCHRRHQLVDCADIASRQAEFTLLPSSQKKCASRGRRPKNSIAKKISLMFSLGTKTDAINIDHFYAKEEKNIVNEEVEEIIGVTLDNESSIPQNVDSAEECTGSAESLNLHNYQCEIEKKHLTKNGSKKSILANSSEVWQLSSSSPISSNPGPSTPRDTCPDEFDRYIQKPSTSNLSVDDDSKRSESIRTPSSIMSYMEKLNIASIDNFPEDKSRLPQLPPTSSKPHNLNITQGLYKIEYEKEEVQLKHLLRKAEQSRRKYIDASAKHHQALKELGLADRVPGKMYDDMQHILKGLSVEKQCELLSTRLRLVNQHLLFERYCRLMHANRNRRLFAQLNQKRSCLAECERLKKSEHQSFVELDQQIQLCKKLRLELDQKTRTLAANEAHFNTTFGELTKEKEILATEINQLQLKYEDKKKSQKSTQILLDKARRHNDDLMAERKLIDQELKILHELPTEFARLQKEKLYLEEEMTRVIEELSRSSASTSIHQTDSITPYYETQLKTLRAQCRKNKCLMNQAQDKVKLMEMQWKEEIDRRMELQAILQRVSVTNHKQVEACQHKFNSLLAISSKQEAHIFNLYRFLEENHSSSKLEGEQFSRGAQPIPICPGSTSKTCQPTEQLSYCDNSFVFSEDHLAITNLFTNQIPLLKYTDQSVKPYSQSSSGRQSFQQSSSSSTMMPVVVADYQSFSMPDELELHKLAKEKFDPSQETDPLQSNTSGQVE